MFLSSTFAALFLAASAAAQTYTYQTNPSNGQFLYSNAGLTVRWDQRPGNSPDSVGVTTPALLSVSLGFKQGETPSILFPPLNGAVSNVPFASGSYTWNVMDFSIFNGGPTPPPRDKNTQWFVQLFDQASGYKSNGNLFYIVDANATAPVPAAPTSAPAAPAPTASTPASSATSAATSTGASAGSPSATSASNAATSAVNSPAPTPATADPSSSASSAPSSLISGSFALAFALSVAASLI